MKNISKLTFSEYKNSDQENLITSVLDVTQIEEDLFVITSRIYKAFNEERLSSSEISSMAFRRGSLIELVKMLEEILR